MFKSNQGGPKACTFAVQDKKIGHNFMLVCLTAIPTNQQARHPHKTQNHPTTNPQNPAKKAQIKFFAKFPQ